MIGTEAHSFCKVVVCGSTWSELTGTYIDYMRTLLYGGSYSARKIKLRTRLDRAV
jgi:hypothetical protein